MYTSPGHEGFRSEQIPPLAFLQLSSSHKKQYSLREEKAETSRLTNVNDPCPHYTSSYIPSVRSPNAPERHGSPNLQT